MGYVGLRILKSVGVCVTAPPRRGAEMKRKIGANRGKLRNDTEEGNREGEYHESATTEC